MISQVGTISANTDKQIGSIIAEAMKKSAKTASSPSKNPAQLWRPRWKLSKACNSTAAISPHFVTDPERMECVLEDVSILIHEKKISSMKKTCSPYSSRLPRPVSRF